MMMTMNGSAFTFQRFVLVQMKNRSESATWTEATLKSLAFNVGKKSTLYSFKNAVLLSFLTYVYFACRYLKFIFKRIIKTDIKQIKVMTSKLKTNASI